MKMRLLFLSVLFLIFSACTSDNTNNENDPNGEDPSPNPAPKTSVEVIEGTIRDITSSQLVAEMGVGWNLGNSFDVRSRDKTFWGNPLPSERIVDAVNSFGFKTIRIPVTWDYNQLKEAPFTIEASYLDEVQKVVNYALKNNMHVILNTHHEDWIIPSAERENEVKARLAAIWTQVANRFKAYGDLLIFETINEPRTIGSTFEWQGGTASERSILNDYHKTALEAIRSTGGNNEKRHVMISTYAASTVPDAMNDLIVPNNDANVIISIHSYFPWSFAGLAQTDWGSDMDKSELEAELDRIKTKWVNTEQRAVILGEWGSISRNNPEQRKAYASFYTEQAVERGLLPIIWDDGGDFQLLDRRSLTWINADIARAVLDADK